jgi:hypothetical protein
LIHNEYEKIFKFNNYAPAAPNNPFINQTIIELAIKTTINQATACIKIVLPFFTLSSAQPAVIILNAQYIIIAIAIKYKNQTKYVSQFFKTTSKELEVHFIHSSTAAEPSKLIAARATSFNPINDSHITE